MLLTGLTVAYDGSCLILTNAHPIVCYVLRGIVKMTKQYEISFDSLKTQLSKVVQTL